MAQIGQSKEFHDRIKRIQNPKNQSYYDPELKMSVPKRVSKNLITRNKEDRISMAALAVSIVVGVMAYIIVQVMSGRFSLLPSSDLVMFGAGAILAIVLGGLIRFKSMPHMAVQVMGVGLMMVGAHNAVWMFPGAVSQVTSQAYVLDVLANTSPNSLMLLGTTYTL